MFRVVGTTRVFRHERRPGVARIERRQSFASAAAVVLCRAGVSAAADEDGEPLPGRCLHAGAKRRCPNACLNSEIHRSATLNLEINKSEPQALTAGQDPAPLRRSNPGADENTPRSDLEMSVNSHPGLPLNWGSSRISLSAAVRSRRAARNPGSGVADPGASQSSPPSGARSAGSSRPHTPSAAP